MPTLAQVRTAVDTKLASLWGNVQTRQANYFATHGRYWQGIITTDVDKLPDNLVSGNLPMAIQIDVYQAPSGYGYIATVYVQYRGTIYFRSASEGPVDGSASWAIYNPNPVGP